MFVEPVRFVENVRPFETLNDVAILDFRCVGEIVSVKIKEKRKLENGHPSLQLSVIAPVGITKA